MAECAIGERGYSTIEWYKFNDEPQEYCRGWISVYTDEVPKECRNCPDHVFNAKKDYEEYLAWIKAGGYRGV